jgi:hypothetical protein
MKTLIENTVIIRGIGHPDTKTIFNIENEDERNHLRFKSLTKISGRKLSVFFKYEEDNSEISDRLQLSIPRVQTENEIKEFILDSINEYLS